MKDKTEREQCEDCFENIFWCSHHGCHKQLYPIMVRLPEITSVYPKPVVTNPLPGDLPFCFNPNLAHLTLLISNTTRSLAVE
uniref:Uncharacterized protein n=1 Tax=Anguilla anguilla TaxID=7936 RepID=A0A0E9X684_ANGAN